MDSITKCYNIMTRENQICFKSLFQLNLNLKCILLCQSSDFLILFFVDSLKFERYLTNVFFYAGSED